jgi:hypothetical protein
LNKEVKIPPQKLVSGFYVPNSLIDQEQNDNNVDSKEKINKDELNDMFYSKFNKNLDFTFIDDIRRVFTIPQYDMICYKCLSTNAYDMEQLYLLALKFQYTGNNIVNVLRNNVNNMKLITYDNIDFKYGYELANMTIDIMLANSLITKEDIKIENKVKFDFKNRFYKTNLYIILTTFISKLYEFMSQNKFAIINRNVVYTTQPNISDYNKLLGTIDRTTIEITNTTIDLTNYVKNTFEIITPEQYQSILRKLSYEECNMIKDSNTGKMFIAPNFFERHLYYDNVNYPLQHNKNLVPNPRYNKNFKDNTNNNNKNTNIIKLTPSILDNNLKNNNNNDNNMNNNINNINNTNMNFNINNSSANDNNDIDNKNMDSVFDLFKN